MELVKIDASLLWSLPSQPCLTNCVHDSAAIKETQSCDRIWGSYFCRKQYKPFECVSPCCGFKGSHVGLVNWSSLQFKGVFKPYVCLLWFKSQLKSDHQLMLKLMWFPLFFLFTFRKIQATLQPYSLLTGLSKNTHNRKKVVKKILSAQKSSTSFKSRSDIYSFSI